MNVLQVRLHQDRIAIAHHERCERGSPSGFIKSNRTAQSDAARMSRMRVTWGGRGGGVGDGRRGWGWETRRREKEGGEEFSSVLKPFKTVVAN